MVRVLLPAGLVCLLAGAAFAQSANSATPAAAPAAEPAKRVKLGALLSQGYEIKAVTVIPQEISSRLAEKPDRDGVLVTLQKGSTAATCLYSLYDYVNSGLLDIVWCIEQK